MMYPNLIRALESDSPDDVELWCRESVSAEAAAMNSLVPKALSGSRAAAFAYVETWRALAGTLLETIRAELPDLVVESDGRLLIADVEHSVNPISSYVLDAEALEAPFSNWVMRMDDIGFGSCAALLQKIRDAIWTLRPVDLGVHGLPHFSFEISGTQLKAFRANVVAALNDDELTLEHIRSGLDLSITELGMLFGVTRQAAAQWLENDVPSKRQAKVATVASIVDLLDAHLKTERIPGIARRQADVYDGLTLLEMIESDRHDELLDRVRASFDWARPA